MATSYTRQFLNGLHKPTLTKKIAREHKLGLADANKIASTVIWHLEDMLEGEVV
jgi:hypothetical protein